MAVDLGGCGCLIDPERRLLLPLSFDLSDAVVDTRRGGVLFVTSRITSIESGRFCAGSKGFSDKEGDLRVSDEPFQGKPLRTWAIPSRRSSRPSFWEVVLLH